MSSYKQITMGKKFLILPVKISGHSLPLKIDSNCVKTNAFAGISGKSCSFTFVPLTKNNLYL